MTSLTASKMGKLGLKTRQLDQISEKLCVAWRGHIFSPILMKLGQNICFDKISDGFESDLCRVNKTKTGHQ